MLTYDFETQKHIGQDDSVGLEFSVRGVLEMMLCGHPVRRAALCAEQCNCGAITKLEHSWTDGVFVTFEGCSHNPGPHRVKVLDAPKRSL